LLPARNIVAGMIRPTGEIDARDAIVRRERVSDLRRSLLLTRDAGKERSEAAQRQIGIERRAGDAGAVGPPRQFVTERPVASEHSAADHIAVSVDELRGRMHDDIAAESERILQRRGQESIVGDRTKGDQ